MRSRHPGYFMNRFVFAAVAIALAGVGVAQAKGGSHAGGSHTSSYGSSSSGSHSVSGHVTKDGTYVAPHQATNPNSTKYDNWSSKGNVNPYTGKEGTKDPSKP